MRRLGLGLESGARPKSGVLRALAGVALLASLAPARLAAGEDLHDAKADLLYNIAKFIEWPRELSVKNQFSFAILGEDELAAVIAGTMSQKTINGKPVFVRCIRRPEDALKSHVLFIAASEEERIPEVLEALRGTSVLTVADTAGFAAMGGMVDFVLADARVHFEINREQAEKARLRISAKLLALAQIVENREP